MTPLRVFIGYDPAETIAYHVAAHSIVSRSTLPVAITPLVLNQLPMWRERDRLQSTEFSFSRFLVPFLCDYNGKALFIDCDMLCLGNIVELFDMKDDKAVQVVKHHYTPSTDTKFLGQVQTAYPRKNWSSVMLFDCGQCQRLTPEYVNGASGLELHRFLWLDDDEIGELPKEWNHLVGEMEPNPRAKLIHYTLGTPCFPAFKDCEFAEQWKREYVAVNGYETRNANMKPIRKEEEAA